MGERATINAAVERLPSHIEWFYILHADDLAKENWLQVNSASIDRASARTAALTASYDVLFPDGQLFAGQDDPDKAPRHIAASHAAVRDTLFMGCWFKISSCCVRVSAFREVGSFREDLPQLGDWEFVLRLFSRGWAIDYLERSLSIYRQLPQSVSSISFRTNRDIRESLSIVHEYRRFLSPWDLCRRHAHFGQLLARRLAASTWRLDRQRFWNGLRLAPTVGSNFWRCLRSQS
jgi:GT2 family glycosyltransferase